MQVAGKIACPLTRATQPATANPPMVFIISHTPIDSVVVTLSVVFLFIAENSPPINHHNPIINTSLLACDDDTVVRTHQEAEAELSCDGASDFWVFVRNSHLYMYRVALSAIISL